MEQEEGKNRVVPESELLCIWMDAGLISYKLCDRNYDCENCPFDIVMRQHSGSTKSPSAAPQKEGTQRMTTRCISNYDYLPAILNSFFAPLLARPIPDDRMYSQGHLWILQEKPNIFTIGIDHIVSHFLKSMQEIVFPQLHTALSTASPCIWIACQEGTITINSPLQGEIDRINSRLIESAHLVRTSPYIDGWLISIFTNESAFSKEKFLKADQAKALFIKQISFIQKEILSELNKTSPKIGQTMLDGGMRAKRLEDIIGITKYFSVLKSLISSGSN